MPDNPFTELLNEFRTVFKGRGSTLDAVLSPLVYLVVNAVWGLTPAVGASLGTAALLFVLRLMRRQPWQYALIGMAGAGLAAGLSLVTRQVENFFLPAIISSAVTLLVSLASLLIRRPLAALASHLTRGWPLGWFRHERVRPAYMEVTWMWSALIALRLALQVTLYLSENAASLAWVNILLGWPVTIAVLAVSYLYGIRRLQKLGGPGVEEFEQNAPPPWQGQKRGF